MQWKFKKMFSVSEIIAFEPVAGIFLIYDENTCDMHSACYQTVLGCLIREIEIFSYSILPRLIENWGKSSPVQDCLGHVNTFSVEGFSKTGAYGH